MPKTGLLSRFYLSPKAKVMALFTYPQARKFIIDPYTGHRGNNPGSLNLYTFGLLASVFRRLRFSIANHHPKQKQSAEGDTFYKISKFLKSVSLRTHRGCVSYLRGGFIVKLTLPISSTPLTQTWTFWPTFKTSVTLLTLSLLISEI